MFSSNKKKRTVASELERLRRSEGTYTKSIQDDDFYKDLDSSECRDELRTLIQDRAIGKHYHNLVLKKQTVSHVDFWLRYYYRCDETRIQQRIDNKRGVKSRMRSSLRKLFRGGKKKNSSVYDTSTDHSRLSIQRSDSSPDSASIDSRADNKKQQKLSLITASSSGEQMEELDMNISLATPSDVFCVSKEVSVDAVALGDFPRQTDPNEDAAHLLDKETGLDRALASTTNNMTIKDTEPTKNAKEGSLNIAEAVPKESHLEDKTSALHNPSGKLAGTAKETLKTSPDFPANACSSEDGSEMSPADHGHLNLELNKDSAGVLHAAETPKHEEEATETTAEAETDKVDPEAEDFCEERERRRREEAIAKFKFMLQLSRANPTFRREYLDLEEPYDYSDTDDHPETENWPEREIYPWDDANGEERGMNESLETTEEISDLLKQIASRAGDLSPKENLGSLEESYEDDEWQDDESEDPEHDESAERSLGAAEGESRYARDTQSARAETSKKSGMIFRFGLASAVALAAAGLATSQKTAR